MFRVAALIWMMLGTTFAGLAIIAVLVMPGQVGHTEMRMVPIAAVLGFLLAVPFAAMIANRVSRS